MSRGWKALFLKILEGGRIAAQAEVIIKAKLAEKQEEAEFSEI